MGNKANAARGNYNRHKGSPSESQKECTPLSTSSKRITKSKHSKPHNVDEDDKYGESTAILSIEMTYKDAIDPT